MDTDLFARPPRKKNPLAPFELNKEGKGKALVLRYAGCNLRCPLCYAWKYAWSIENGHEYRIRDAVQVLNNLYKNTEKKIVWVRIQGGEPCLNFQRTLNTITFAERALSKIHEYDLNYYKNTRAVIQTNGIIFSTPNDSRIGDVKSHLYNSLTSLDSGKIVFEVSFKSPCDSDILNKQLSGFDVLLNRILLPIWDEGLDNVSVYPVAGLGPSVDSHTKWIIPVEPSFLPDEIPLFHPKTWSPQFRKMLDNFKQNVIPNYQAFSDFRKNPRTDNGRKIAIEELEPTKFQMSWISGYAGGYSRAKVNVPLISNVLRKLSNDPDPQWLALFKMNEKWLKVLDEIPVSNNPDKLLEFVQEMENEFYPSHPIGHYPYL